MLSVWTIGPSLVLHAATVSPRSLPARGQAEALVTIDRPAMVRLTATSSRGTRCELVDQLRGPFVSSGGAGGKSCDFDQLLDAGTYKLRLSSPDDGTGQVVISARPFPEVNAQALKLALHGTVERGLEIGEQASYWIVLDRPSAVTLRVFGRTAGSVHLWRNGEWLEEVPAEHLETKPLPGQPIHEWWLETFLGPGSYRVAVYGTAAKEWTRGEPSNRIWVAYGFPELTDSSPVVTLPASGAAAFELPIGPTVAFASLLGPSSAATSLSIRAMDENGRSHFSTIEGGCSIAAGALVTECIGISWSRDRHLLLIRGAPGSVAELHWNRYSADIWRADGDYGPPVDDLAFKPPHTGRYLLLVDEVPIDQDALPLSCIVEQMADPPIRRGGDLLSVGTQHPFERSVNYNGSEGQLWFQTVDDGSYEISATGGRGNRCELYKLNGKTAERLTETNPAAQSCRIIKSLAAGTYQLSLYGGTAGIDTLRIAAAGSGSGKTRSKSSCLLPEIFLEVNRRYRILLSRPGETGTRGLVLRPLPLSLDQALPLRLESGATVVLAVRAGAPLRIASSGSRGSFTCQLGRGPRVQSTGGVCDLSASTSEQLTLSNLSNEVLALSLRHPAAPDRAKAAVSEYALMPIHLPRLSLDSPAFLDFGRQEVRSLLFEVMESGLYDVTTEGLLATECAIRSPAVPAQRVYRGGGRGRNCLVSSYLQAGQYLATVQTVGASKGRGGVRFRQRPVRRAPDVSSDGPVFFTAHAQELIQQHLSVGAAASYQVSTATPKGTLECRLDDPQGWPLLPVPTSCSGLHLLRPGLYLWTQLPLTVESQRRTSLIRAQAPPMLSGDQMHPVALNTWYEVMLGAKGRDTFEFSVASELDVDVALTNDMQARLFALGSDPPRLVELIPPQNRWAKGRPAGRPIHLPDGRYQVVAEHSRGDVGITYRFRIGSNVLIPGVSLEAPVPARIPLRMPTDGTLRLRSDGDLAVRCRVLDSDGRPRFESRDDSANWNCSAAELLPKGNYLVALESPNLDTGQTRITASMLQVERSGTLSDGAVIQLRESAQVLDLPEAGAAVQQVSIRSKQPFSCALERNNGEVVHRQSQVDQCQFSLSALNKRFHLRLWTGGGVAHLAVAYAARPLSPFSGRTIPRGRAVIASVDRPGRYLTSGEFLCSPADRPALLRPCGSEVSLEAGPVIFVSPDGSGDVPLSVREKVLALDREDVQAQRLSIHGFLQRQKSKDRAIHLFSASVPFGERNGPACEIRGGVRELRENACFAASGSTFESVASVWSPQDGASDAQLFRRSLVLSSNATPLAKGKQSLHWEGPVGRYALPLDPARVELILPAGAWAVRLSPEGRAMDLCPPEASLFSCVLGAQGGEVVLYSPRESRAGATVVVGEAPATAIALTGIHEEEPKDFGLLRFVIPLTGVDRWVSVSGAQRCGIIFTGGERQSGCQFPLPKGMGADLWVAHAKAPLRAAVGLRGAPLEAQFGPLWPPAPSSELPPGQAAHLSGGRIEHAFTLAREAAVQVHAQSGVCAIQSDQGLLEVSGPANGCVVSRPLPPGRYRILVRPFAARPLNGTLSWIADSIDTLNEGVGAERWIAPDQVQLFRFAIRASGRVGLGVQMPGEQLECSIFDQRYGIVGQGCQQYPWLNPGDFYLAIRAPSGVPPTRFRPVILGLDAPRNILPEEYLRDFFQRIGASP